VIRLIFLLHGLENEWKQFSKSNHLTNEWSLREWWIRTSLVSWLHWLGFMSSIRLFTEMDSFPNQVSELSSQMLFEILW
jgi:hypothetical protein